MQQTQNKQAGFNIVELLLIIVAVGIIGGGGWFVYQHNRTKVSDAAAGTQTTQQTTTTTTPAPTVTYLDIKEWGIKLPLSDSIKDAYYVVSTGSVDANGQPNTMLLGSASLNNACGQASLANEGNPTALGDIGRALPTDHEPVKGTLYTQLYPGTTIGSYYYFYISGTNGKTCAPQATLQSIDSAFSAAAKGIIAATTN